MALADTLQVLHCSPKKMQEGGGEGCKATEEREARRKESSGGKQKESGKKDAKRRREAAVSERNRAKEAKVGGGRGRNRARFVSGAHKGQGRVSHLLSPPPRVLT